MVGWNTGRTGVIPPARCIGTGGTILMAFTDPIVANEELVRASIRSSNFDPTDPLSVGWQINRDGTATFSNVNVKGIASGPAASYNAVAANNSFTYKGTELQTILDLFSKGIIAYYA